MNGRIKPRFEDLANAALQKPTYTTPNNAFVPPGGHELAIAEFQKLSQDTKRNQYHAASLLAKAQQIAQDQAISVEIALGAMAREQSGQQTGRDMAAQASASSAGQDRYDLLDQDRMMGQLALKFRHNAQMSSVAQQIRASANPFCRWHWRTCQPSAQHHQQQTYRHHHQAPRQHLPLDRQRLLRLT